MHTPDPTDATARRLTDLEIKASFMEDLVDQLNTVVVRQQGASLLPHIDNLRAVSMTVAAAVAEAAVAEGLARVKVGDVVQTVQDAMWPPEYRRIQAA